MSPEIPEALRVAVRFIEMLDDLGVAYHLGGSIASSVHGIPRMTQDVDVVARLTPENTAALARIAAAEFYMDADVARTAVLERTSFNLIHRESGMKIDIFVRGDAPFDIEEFRRHRRERVRAQPPYDLFVKSPEDTLLRKLQWYRLGGEVSDRQWADVLGVIRTQAERLDRAYLQQWSQDLGVADLLERALSA